MKQLNKIKVLIGPSSFAALDRYPMDLLIENCFEVIDNPFKRKLTKQELLNLLSEDVSALIAGLEPLDREVLEKTKLKVISRVGSGLSNIDLDAAKEFGIEVRYTPYGPTNAVAELSVGIMLNIIRMVPQMNRALHSKQWNKMIGSQLEGKNVVIIGFGRIGRRVAELLSAFSVKLLIVDPYIESLDSFSLVSLEEVLPIADIITLHSSGESCIIGDAEFGLVKKGVFILNAARGGLVSEAALIKALNKGVVAGAWLDTFETEPYTGPLIKYDQVVLTPHIGSYAAECRRRMETEAVENLIKSIRDK